VNVRPYRKKITPKYLFSTKHCSKVMTYYPIYNLARQLRRALWGAITILVALSSAVMAQTVAQLASDIETLKKVAFEELFNLEITTVSRRPERLVDAASAIQVITAEEIRRSGASSLPEALRLASNLQVAQIDSSRWAISARGFNSATANKLLVLIDGRSVYTPLFSGVFWDVQNVMLEDIDRIEVISGPGGTLWGANAVNGVINVITKSARDTQGALLSGGAGSFLKGFGNARYGGKIGEDGYFRLYGMGFDRDNTRLRSGREADSDWFLGQGGFRADWLPQNGTKATFQGNFYGGEISQAAPGNVTVDGQNLIGRWTQPLAHDSDLSVQVYWDRTRRRIPNAITEVLNTYDIELQHRLPLGERNKLIWGGGYRLMQDEVDNTAAVAFLPARRDLHLFSAFVQDEIALVRDRLFLTVGSKFEHNDYSGFEFQPSVRLAWMPAPDQTIWAALSRAVRSPSRIDTEVFAPSTPPFFLRGGGDRYDSETVIAYELGYRAELAQTVGLSISTFFNDYDDIRSVEPIAGAPGQTIILNRLRGETYGAEVSATWQPLDRWQLRGGYTYFRKKIFFGGSLDVNNGRSEGNDPQHQFLVQSMINLPADLEFDSVLRYVDNLNQRGPTVPSYVSLDLRLGWRPTPNWEFAIVGQNLLDKRHAEFGTPANRQEIPRSVYGKVTWRFWTGNNGAN
jgi:iron complex outermembrane recepter protein